MTGYVYSILPYWGRCVEKPGDYVILEGQSRWEDVTHVHPPTRRGWMWCFTCGQWIDPDEEQLGINEHLYHFWEIYKPIWQRGEQTK